MTTELGVLLVDDHRVFTELLGYALDARPGLRCVGQARTVAAARELARRTPFDVAVVDVHLPDGDGIALAAELRDAHPGARCLALTGLPSPALLRTARECGVTVLTKDGSVATILDALGPPPADPVPRPSLTAREREVLELLAEGMDATAMARALRISVHTARGHVKVLLQKTGTRSQLEAVAVARRARLLEPVG